MIYPGGARIIFELRSASLGDKYSNNREFRNLVKLVEEELKSGRMVGIKLFLFTDNYTSEWCFYKGTYTDPKLFDMMVSLKKLILRGGHKIHIIWVAGTLQIESGMDGLSQGGLTKGFIKEIFLRKFAVLSETAL